jgi:hypothetical protein
VRHGQLRRAGALTRSTALVVGTLAAVGSCGGGRARDTLATARGVESTTTISASPVAASAAHAAPKWRSALAGMA